MGKVTDFPVQNSRAGGRKVGKACNVYPLPMEFAVLLWDEFSQHFERAALEHPAPFDMAELREQVARGELMTVGIFDGQHVMIAGALVELIEARDGRVLNVRYLGGGDIDQWLLELQTRVREIARAYGCKFLGLTGRLAWQRKLKPLGWYPSAIQMRCEV